MTSTERARAYKARMDDQDMAQFMTWLPRAQCAELRAVCEALKANPDMRVCSIALQDGKTGRMKGVKLR